MSDEQDRTSESGKCDVAFLRPGDRLDEWDAFVSESPQGCIFCKSWWLDAVCPNGFEILTLRKGGKIVAGMPLTKFRRGIWVGITMPGLTQTLGVLLAPQQAGGCYARLSKEMEALRALVAAIPKADFFSVAMHHTLTNWLPFYWAGYSQTTRYTYVLDDLSDPEAAFSGMAPSTRNKIRKAEKSGIRVEETEDVEAFLELNKKTFARQGMELPYTEAEVRRLDAACADRGARRIFCATDGLGRTHSALYVVYDEKCMYNLMQGGDPELRSSGANPLAMWRSIQLAHELGVPYDFEGSMLANVEGFFRSFGAAQKPYFEVSRFSSIGARAAAGLRSLATRARRRLGLRR